MIGRFAFVALAGCSAALGSERGWGAVEGGISQGDLNHGHSFAGRAIVELAPPRPLGWHGALALERVEDRTVLALQPIGVALRDGRIALGLSGGASLAGPQDGRALQLALSGGAWLDVALPGTHAALIGQIDHPTGSSVTYSSACLSVIAAGDDRIGLGFTAGAFHVGAGQSYTGAIALVGVQVAAD